MDWKEKAIRTLRDSLYPVPEELNELEKISLYGMALIAE